MFPVTRMRRLRMNQKLREMVQETEVNTGDLIYPIFVDENIKEKLAIKTMPGIYRYPLIDLPGISKEIQSLGIKSIILFGVPSCKDELASSAYEKNGIIQRAIKTIKNESDLLVIADLCMCEYTSHGHCGIVENGRVDNDKTLEIYKKIAISYAEAGVDIVAPSGMMDGQVGAIRSILDSEGFEYIPIMAYSAKYASSLYSPFREAAESAPKFGDRKTYQMNYANSREAIREIELDIMEGADIIMVKPAILYLDIIKMARERYQVPIAAYNVSGEYSMVKFASMEGAIDEESVVRELLTSIKRAGADLIITYHALDFAKWNKKI
ncbi:MAG: porphobilinogen synthase [Thermoplasmata archaeon]|jgi:porphobilinogen synthase|nr:porphobilinogen synthase [Euryarchaeota archaeon]MVT14537.1 porphobilinogen synthase [Euryarchaeota archaeon]MVT35423.1 porphobilinogen synthase [Euryarchaeota archaeon]